MDQERKKDDGTPTLGTLVLYAAQGAEADGAISVDDLQELRRVAAILNERGIDTLEAFEKLVEKK